MTRAVALLGVLPAIRKGFLTTLLLSGVFDMVASIVLLSYQLALTVRSFSSLSKNCRADALVRLTGGLPTSCPVHHRHLLLLRRLPRLVPLLPTIHNPSAGRSRGPSGRNEGQGCQVLEVNRSRVDLPRWNGRVGPDRGQQLACRVS